MRTLVVLAFVVVMSGRADAYPQWQLSRDITCTGCHLSPDGGGLLNENGLVTAESAGMLGHDPAFMYGKLDTPAWLTLGGDLRGATGFIQTRDPDVAAYPMQGELAGAATFGAFSVHALVGGRRPSEGESPLHVVWSREHYLMWQQKPGENTGAYVRVGRLMPTFGLRLAEHVVYTQRYGGRQLYTEAYGLAASYVDPRFEVHATGFIHDPIATSIEHGDGAALYAETRIGERAAVGIEGKYTRSDEQTRTFGGVTGKLYIPGIELLLLGEAQLIRQHIDAGDWNTNQLAAFVMASRPLPRNFLLDVGIGHFTQDMRVKGLYRDALDVNLHYFLSSHAELLLTTRLEHLGGNGPTGGYALGQLHYRL